MKSTCNDTIRNKFNYADSAKSTCNDKIKSTIANINYLDIPKSTCADKIKRASAKIINILLLMLLITLIIKVHIVKSTLNLMHY